MDNRFDPNRTPLSTPAPGYQHFRSVHGKITVNENTGVVLPIENGPNFPVEIPVEFVDFNQPFVHTCSEEKKDSSGMVLNKGCQAWNGCAIVQWFKGRQYRKPTNVIVEKNGHIDSVPCFSAYGGYNPVTMRPTSQVRMLYDGWKILQDRTTIPQNMLVDGRWQVVETEVPNLAPFYDDLKLKKAAAAAEVKPKRGRPKKNVEPAPAA